MPKSTKKNRQRIRLAVKVQDIELKTRFAVEPAQADISKRQSGSRVNQDD
jgi:hypothetical protein